MNIKIEVTDINNNEAIMFLIDESFKLFLEIYPEHLSLYLHDEKVRNDMEHRYKKTFIENLDKNDIIYTAHLDDEIIGCGLIRDNGYLDSLFVKEEYRNQKIGSKLLEKIINECIDFDIITVDARIEAISLYEKFSFQKTGVSNGIRVPMKLERSYYGK